MAVQFSYDAQVRRFVLQFVRLLSNFQVEFGQNSQGNTTLQTVPVYYGDVSRQAAMILRGNSENTLNAVPAMATYISALTYDRERVLSPNFESSVRVREQIYDPASQSYTGTQDGLYTVERIMPAPYRLQMKVDVWTSNTEQKHQLFEQIAPLFNPALEIQNSDNYVDWGSLSAVFLTDVAYSNRSVPVGGDDATIDIMTMTFEMPIWISLPAKVKKMGVVAQIIASLYESDGTINPDFVNTMNGLVSQQQFSPMDYDIVYIGNTITLYKVATDNNGEYNGNKSQWAGLVNVYGQLTNGISQVRLRFEHIDGYHSVVGTVAYDPIDPYSLLFTPIAATLPANTLPPVTAIIDPYNVPVDSNILSPATGTRYLILNPIGAANSPSAPAWAGNTPGKNLIANANDIIEWNGNYWTVSFDSRNSSVQYVTNLNTTTQYYWDGTQWAKSVEGLYRPGEWSLVL